MGKTTLAGIVTDRLVVGTDTYKQLDWAVIPERMIAEVGDAPRFLIEGVQVARALRKGLEVDAVIFLTRPKVNHRKPGQIAMAKGVWTVFQEWREANPDVPVFIERTRK